MAMSTAELKLKLFREIDTLENSRLERVYGVLLNFINNENDTSEFDSLSPEKQEGLLKAIEEMNSSEGIDHKIMMDNFKSKYE